MKRFCLSPLLLLLLTPPSRADVHVHAQDSSSPAWSAHADASHPHSVHQHDTASNPARMHHGAQGNAEGNIDLEEAQSGHYDKLAPQREPAPLKLELRDAR